jgi:hypothetical protein
MVNIPYMADTKLTTERKDAEKRLREAVSSSVQLSKLFSDFLVLVERDYESDLLQLARQAVGIASSEQLIRSQASACGAIYALKELREVFVHRPVTHTETSQQGAMNVGSY